MGLFSRKFLGEEPVLSSLLVTFGQAIEATEKANGFELPQAWDLFANKVGWLADNKFISEEAMNTIVSASNFEVGRDLVIDLVELRKRGEEVTQFTQEFQSTMETRFPAGMQYQGSKTPPKAFMEFLVQISKETYPLFGSTDDDQKFYAVLAIFLANVYIDSDSDSATPKTFRRFTALNFGLQFFAEWNISKELS